MSIFVKYLLIQVLLYFVDYGVFIIFLFISNDTPVYANIIGKISAGIVGCIVHRRFTFNISDSHNRYAHYIKYFSILALNIPLSSGILSLLLTFFPYPKPVKFLSDVICLFISFSLLKYFAFTKNLTTKTKF